MKKRGKRMGAREGPGKGEERGGKGKGKQQRNNRFFQNGMELNGSERQINCVSDCRNKCAYMCLFRRDYISRESQTTRNVHRSRASVCLSVCPSPHSHTTSRTRMLRGEWQTGCPLVVHCWADLQSEHGFRCYDNIAPSAKRQPVLVLALCSAWFENFQSTSVHSALEALRLCAIEIYY